MKPHSPVDERQKFQLDRIALFSDAVFAIAITLLIIEIKVPVLPADRAAFPKEFWHALKEMIPELVGFVISFLVIGSFWQSHHAIFGFVKDYDRKLISLNTWYLFTIVCMPFTTAFMSRYMTIQPYIIYCLNIIASGLIQIWLWRYITDEKNKLCDPIPPGVKTFKTIASMLAIAGFLFSVGVHYMLGGLIARISLLFVFIIQHSARKHFRKKYGMSIKF